jgi:hypothetical protein
MLNPTDPVFVVGSPQEQAQARAEWHRQRLIAQLMRADNVKEIPRADLRAFHAGVLEDTRTGEFYRPRRDGVIDLQYTQAVAYFFDAAGSPIVLERPSGIQNRAEFEERQAERERRRSAPRPKPTWKR